jgi:hypothetical protein
MKAFPNVFMDYIPAPEHRGMDLRDYFAAQAMQGLIAADRPFDFAAQSAYIIADMMIEARK